MADVAWLKELRRREQSFRCAVAGVRQTKLELCPECGELAVGVVVAAGEVVIHEYARTVPGYRLTFRVPFHGATLHAPYFGAKGTHAYNQIADALVPEADERGAALDDDDFLGRWCLVRIVPPSRGRRDSFEVVELVRATA